MVLELDILDENPFPGIRISSSVLFSAHHDYKSYYFLLPGHVSHVVHWIWSISATKPDRHVVNAHEYDQWGHMLCTIFGTHDQPDPITGLVQAAVSRKGMSSGF